MLHTATSGKNRFEWNAEMQEAFEGLNSKFTTPLALAFPYCKASFVLETDVSAVALGVVSSQRKEDGKINPVQYAFLTMTDVERRYSTSEREALAVVLALNMFGVYVLSDVPFVVLSDHQALHYAFRMKNIHGRLARWMELMAEYEVEVKYRPDIAKKVAV